MSPRVYLTEIPYDRKSSFMRGAGSGPARIREQLYSSAYNAYGEGVQDLFSGILQEGPQIDVSDYSIMRDSLVSKVAEGRRYMFLGGDHSISYATVRAIHQHTGPLHIVHFDAHGDLYDELDGDRWSHACPFARILEDGLVQSLTQVGIRALTPLQVDQINKYDVRVFTMDEVHRFRPETLEGPLYISFDMDALDPAFAPGVSHRESGGLTVRQVLTWFHQIKAKVVGADLVEYNPLQDTGQITAATGAKIVRELVALIAQSSD